MRSPAPCVLMALAAPALARPPTGSSPRSPTASSSPLNPDGTGLRTLWTPPSGEITGPAWSPDGNKLAFSYGGRITSSTSPTGAVTRDHRRRDARRRTRLVAGRHADRVPARRPRRCSRCRRRRRSDAAAHVARWTRAATATRLRPTSTRCRRRGRLGCCARRGLRARRLVVAARRPGRPTASGSRSSTPAGCATVCASGPAAPPSRFTRRSRRRRRAGRRTAPRSSIRRRRVRTVAAAAREPRDRAGGRAAATARRLAAVHAGRTVSCRSRLAAELQRDDRAGDHPDRPAGRAPGPPCTDPRGCRCCSCSSRRRARHARGPALHARRRVRRAGLGHLPGQQRLRASPSRCGSRSSSSRARAGAARRPTARRRRCAAPFLSARVKPRLDRKRTTLVRLACDQACSFDGAAGRRAARPKKTLKGTSVKRTLAAGRVLALRLKLPTQAEGHAQDGLDHRHRAQRRRRARA